MERILIVDDESSFLDFAGDVLRDAGYEARGCLDPLKTMEKLATFKFDCILLDYHMPDLDGQDLLRLIHTKYPDLPIIICSAFIDVRESDLKQDGAVKVLHKPFDSQVLVVAVQSALAGKEDDEMSLVPIKGYDLRKARNVVMRKIIIKALAKVDFNITHAAKLLGISRQYLLRYLKHYQINAAAMR